MKTFNHTSKALLPLLLRTKVVLLTSRENQRWTVSGTIVQRLPFRKYKVKLDGSGRILIRNRRFIGQYFSGRSMTRDDLIDYTVPSSKNQLPDQLTSSQTLPDQFSSSQNQFPDPILTDSVICSEPSMSREAKRLLPYNRPGHSESLSDMQHRTTRSGRNY